MRERVFKIFLDFDGTISEQDVGEAIFRTFADEEKANKIVDDLLNDRISSRDCWIRLCDVVAEINKTELDKFIDKLPLDKTFKNFKNYCADELNDIYVLSDGFDYYINRIFEKNGIEGLTVYSNHLDIVDGKMIPSFPYYNDSSFSSANCKRNHIIHHSSDSDFTVFIGDGNSDKDSVEYCDFIFAKSDLLRYCEMERITFYPFNNFNDVIKKLKKLKSKKNLKKRSRARLKRNQAYLNE